MRRVLIISLISLLLLGLFSCKKDPVNTSPQKNPGWLWVVNLDSVAYSVFGGPINNVVLLKPKEKSRLYTMESKGWMAFGWVAQGSQDTMLLPISVGPDGELTFFLAGKKSFQMYYSECFSPPKDKALVRFLPGLTYDSLVGIHNADTVSFPRSRFSSSFLGFIDTCNFIAPGKYDLYLNSTPFAIPEITQSNVEFNAGKVYFVYPADSTTIAVIER